MARILMDGFEYGLPTYDYISSATSEDYRGTEWQFYRYAEYSSSYSRAYSGVATDVVRSGTYSLAFGDWHSASTRQVRTYATRPFISPAQEIYGRIYYYPATFDTLDADIIGILSETNAYLLRFRVDKSEGTLIVYDHAGTAIGTLPSVPPGGWVKLEFRIDAQATGIIQVWQNNDLIITYNGDTIGANTIPAKLRIGAAISTVDVTSGNFLIYYDDIAINDTIGTVNNGRCGGGAILGLRPKANGSYSDFVPSAGTNYENVNEAFPDGDATYNQSNTVGDIDTYIFESLETDKLLSTSTPINAISIEYQARWYTEPASMSFFIKDGLAEHESTSLPLQGAYWMQSYLMDISPLTSTNWTVSSVDSAEFGIKHTTLVV